MKPSNESRRLFLKKSAATISSAFLFFPGTCNFLTNLAHPPRKNVKFRFAVASDGHYGQPETSYEKDFPELISRLNNEKKTKGLDLAIFNGDLIHDKPEFLPQVKLHFNQLKTPYYTVRGNHDMVDETIWKQTWGYGLNHDFEVDKYGFILADTSNEKGEYVCADINWLNGRLNHYTSKKHVFVFMHITPEKWTKHGIDCPDIKKSIANFPNVAAVFHGHDHDVDDVKFSNNKPYIFDGHFGGSWGVDYKGYRIVEINNDGSVYTYQYNPQGGPLVNENQLSVSR